MTPQFSNTDPHNPQLTKQIDYSVLSPTNIPYNAWQLRAKNSHSEGKFWAKIGLTASENLICQKKLFNLKSENIKRLYSLNRKELTNGNMISEEEQYTVNKGDNGTV